MANAVLPRWHGDNYQARVFWHNALNLLDPTSSVVEVSFEADGPKAFDDVVVKYFPHVPRSGSDRISAEYHQVKWHVDLDGRFGYEDFINPEFIGAKTFSLLQRLREARKVLESNTHFSLITTHRIKDNDPIGALVSGVDKSLLLEKLFDGTTDKSANGKVRKLWREHLELNSDAELRAVVTGLRIVEGHYTLEELRAQINLKAQCFGLLSFGDSNSDFRYDELARQLKARGINSLNKQSLERLCREEGLLSEKPSIEDGFLNIAVRSFLGPAADIVGALPENTLLLTEYFKQRYLIDGLEWQTDIRPKVEAFLKASVVKSSQLRIILDAHASIAFLAGAVLDLKSGVQFEIVQKGRLGSRTWAVDNGLIGPLPRISKEIIGPGSEIALALNISQSVEAHTRQYIATNLNQVGMLISFSMPSGPGQQNILSGSHASAISDQISNAIRELKSENVDAAVHLFAACPNALLFLLGQQHQGVSPCIVYEYDFDRKGNKTYHPSFLID